MTKTILFETAMYHEALRRISTAWDLPHVAARMREVEDGRPLSGIDAAQVLAERASCRLELCASLDYWESFGGQQQNND